MLEPGWPASAVLERWDRSTDDEVLAELAESKIGDGLPIVRPTRAKIDAFLQAARLKPRERIATIPLFNTEATAEAIAVCAILAGCAPAQMPVVCATARALADPALNAIGLLSTTGSAALAVVVNGPIRKELGFNFEGNALGPGSRANATTGRALAFVTRGIGGAIAGLTDMSTMGQPAKYTFCFAENEEASVWEPLHVERGLRPEQSAVTLVGIAGTIEIVNPYAMTPDEMFALAARTMAGTSGVHLDIPPTIGGGDPFVVVSPEWVQTFDQHNISKADVKLALFERIGMAMEDVPPKAAEHLRALRREAGVALEAPLRIARRPEEIGIVVAGGVGIKQCYLPSWSGGSRSVTVAI